MNHPPEISDNGNYSKTAWQTAQHACEYYLAPDLHNCIWEFLTEQKESGMRN
jgi:hypothetical protein